jgi:hypothetical protein
MIYIETEVLVFEELNLIEHYDRNDDKHNGHAQLDDFQRFS